MSFFPVLFVFFVFFEVEDVEEGFFRGEKKKTHKKLSPPLSLSLFSITGPGCAIAAAIADAAGMTTGSSASSPNSPRRRIIAVEGDSAFGFSLAEVETAARFNLPITFVILNNGGVYGGDRRARALAADAARGAAGGGFAGDPPPTAFAPGARHDLIAAAFGAGAFLARDAGELREALRKATLGTDESDRDPGTCVIDVVLDPMAGVESGSVHGFNAPAAASL